MSCDPDHDAEGRWAWPRRRPGPKPTRWPCEACNSRETRVHSTRPTYREHKCLVCRHRTVEER